MHHAPLRAVGVAFLTHLALCVPTQVHALTSAELQCQETIGTAGARFAERAHAALMACDNAIVVGKSCNTSQRDAVIASAASKLGDQLAQDCGQVILEHLGFPGECTDSDGGAFSVDNLTSCI